MKAKKSLLAVAAAATVISGLPLPVLADEQDQPNTPDVNTVPEGPATEAPAVAPAYAEVKKVSLKFVNEAGEEINLNVSNFDDKFVKDTAEGNTVEFDLSDIKDASFKLPEDFNTDQIHAEFDEENKTILRVTFGELTEDLEVPVTVTTEVSADEFEALPGETDTDETVNPVADNEKQPVNITVNFVGKDGKEVGTPFTATYLEGDTDRHSFFLPTVPGYEVKDLPTNGSVTFEFGEDGRVYYSFSEIEAGDYNYEIKFTQAMNSYKVNYFYQNIDDDEYSAGESETKEGYTDDKVAQDLNKPVEGFYALNYSSNERIAADGTTEVNIFYNRKYVLVTFDLDGGYGVEPVYEKYGAPLHVGQPTKGGYGFNGWKDANGNSVQLPSTVPAVDTAYTADWSTQKTSFTVVYWYENVEGTGYNYKSSKQILNVDSGTIVSADTYQQNTFDDKSFFTYDARKTGNEKISVKGDGTTVLNVYYSRNEYTLKFYNKQSGWYRELLATITAKYEADISDQWPTTAKGVSNFKGWQRTGFNSTYATKRTKLVDQLLYNYENGSTTEYWPVTDSRAITKNVEYYIESLEPKTGVNNNGTYFTKSDIYSQTIYTSYSSIDYKDIEGLTAFNGNTSAKYDSKNVAKLYYVRNRHNLYFSNGKDIKKTVTNQMYEMPLAKIKDSDGNLVTTFVPECPDTFDKGAFEFGGWYKTPECYEDSKVALDELTMPDEDLTLYAKWVPIVHTISLYQLESHVGEGNHYSQITDLPHGQSVLPEKHPANPTYGQYEFLGWFYRDGNKEKAFDFKNSVVNQDHHLYAKYRTDVSVNVTVKYVTVKNGVEVDIADPTVLEQLALTTATVNAKGDDELYDGYKEGYFPTTKSHSITFDPEGTLEYKFVYEEKGAVPYTVRYVKKDENGKETELLTSKTFPDNKKAVVTEVAPAIPGHIADQYSKRLVVSTEEGAVNEIVFYYTEDDIHAFYTVNHWLDTQPTAPAKTKTEQMLKTDLVKPDQESYNGFELESVDYTNGTDKVTYTAEEWANEPKKAVGNGAAYDFHYKAVYYVHYSHLDNPVKRGLVADAANGGFNTVDNVPSTHLYAGLFKDAAYATPFSDGSENGLGIHASKPGQNYYVKTISRKYMRPALYAVYNKSSRKIDRIDAFTFIDDDNYNSVSNGITSFDADVAGNIYDRVNVIQKNSDGSSTTTQYSARSFYTDLSENDKIAGDLVTYGANVSEPTATYTLRPYFITKDGVKVDSRQQSTYTIQDRSYDKISVAKESYEGDTTSAAGTVASRQLRRMAAYMVGADLPEPEQPDVPAEPEQPVVTTTVEVTTVVNGSESKFTAEKGDILSSLTPEDISGYVFAGWYSDSDYSTPADLTNVQENITIYGRYVKLSEISISAKKVSSRKSNVTAEISCQLDNDVLGDLALNAEYNGKSIPVSLNKQSVSVGSFFDRLFGKANKVTEYSGKVVLENVKGSKEMTVSLTWTTADGTQVTGPAKTFTVSKGSIR